MSKGIQPPPQAPEEKRRPRHSKGVKGDHGDVCLIHRSTGSEQTAQTQFYNGLRGSAWSPPALFRPELLRFVTAPAPPSPTPFQGKIHLSSSRTYGAQAASVEKPHGPKLQNGQGSFNLFHHSGSRAVLRASPASIRGRTPMERARRFGGVEAAWPRNSRRRVA